MLYIFLQYFRVTSFLNLLTEEKKIIHCKKIQYVITYEKYRLTLNVSHAHKKGTHMEKFNNKKNKGSEMLKCLKKIV